MYSTPPCGSSMVLRSLALLMALGGATPAMAQFDIPGTKPSSQESGNTLVNVGAEIDGSAVVPGESFLLGVRYTIKPGWHIYWRNAGESGSPTELSLSLPEGFTAGAIRWPRPEIFTSMGDTSFGYSKETMLFVPIQAPATVQGEEVSIGIKTAWLVCKEVCLFGEKELTLKAPLAKAGDVVRFKREDATSLFSRMLGQVPKPLTSMPGAQAECVPTSEGMTLKISGPARRGAKVVFVPDHTPGVRYQGKAPFSATIRRNGFLVEVPLEVALDDALGQPLRAAGVLIIGTGDSSPALTVEVPIPETEKED